MSDWGQESEDLFRSARQALSPTTADRDRMRARLAMKIGASAAALSVATSTSKAAASAAATAGAGAGAGAGGASIGTGAAMKAAALPLLAKIVAPIVIVGAVGTAAIAPRLIHDAPAVVATTTSAPAVLPAPKATAAATAASADETPPALSVSISDLPTAPAASTTHHAGASSLVPPKPAAAAAETARDEEAALVAEIDAALRAGDAPRASRLADDHQRRFPTGLLVEEREGARVLGRCMTTPSAAMATEFLGAHPRSPMRVRILAACGTSADRP